MSGFELNFGRAQVFYPEATATRCTAALLLDIDPVEMVRGGARFREGLLGRYVNDRPYVASSFMSVAIAQVLGSAMGGRCKERPDLADKAIPLTARLSVLPCRGGSRGLNASSDASHSVECTNVSSVFWQWKASRWIHGCEPHRKSPLNSLSQGGVLLIR